MKQKLSDKTLTAIDKLQGKEYPKFYCETCGELLIRKGEIKVTSFDISTGEPSFGAVLRCPRRSFITHRTQIYLSKDGSGDWTKTVNYG